MMQTQVTAVVREVETPRPPAYSSVLLYTMYMEEGYTENDLLDALAVQRHEEIEGFSIDKELLQEIRDGLELVLVFEGEPKVLNDYRD